jgi:hypothetical protein
MDRVLHDRLILRLAPDNYACTFTALVDRHNIRVGCGRRPTTPPPHGRLSVGKARDYPHHVASS